MIYLIFFFILSFLFEGAFSVLLPIYNSFFLPLFTVTSFVILYPYFNKYDSPFFIFCIVIGLCYDIIYTNTIFIHAMIFLILGYFISLFYRIISYRIWSCFFILISSIMVYRIMSFLLLAITGYISFDILRLFHSIYSSILINVLYAFLLYGILKLLQRYKKVICYH